LQQLLQDRVRQVVGRPQSLPRGLQLGKSEQELVDKFVTTEVTRLGLAKKVQSLQQSLLANQQRANLLPRLRQRQLYLQRQLETAKANYEILVRRLQEVQIAENQNIGNARIVAIAPVPKQAVDSKRALMLGGGVIVGGLLYILTAFILDLRDRSLKTVKEIRAAFRYPWLGLIPQNKPQQAAMIPQLPMQYAPYTMVGEAYRMLQANLRFLNPDQAIKTIGVTSVMPKEGKSTVTANLALALTEINCRVLLIDADLHHPMQHRIWDLANHRGLSDLIMNQVKFPEVIHRVQPNLNIIPAGTMPPNPLALLASKQMAALVEDCCAHYDFVIFDTPPVGVISDVLTLGKLTDGLLLVARPGVIDRDSAETAQNFLLRSGAVVLGMVINNVVISHEPDSYLRQAEAYYGKTRLERQTIIIPA
jgi:capsular exopolysaccharide synthesis family protein